MSISNINIFSSYLTESCSLIFSKTSFNKLL
nr:MAG TPA: hypothetical protein [Caudoviricetes sp.]